MKTMTMMLVACLMIASPALAQTKLWSWKPKDQTATHVLHAVAMNQKGAAAFVLAELEGAANPSWLIVWINEEGKVLMTKRIATDAEKPTLLGTKVAGQTWEVADWKIAFLGPETVAVTNGTTIRIYRSKDGKIPTVKILDKSDAMIFSNSEFSGWLAKDTEKGSIEILGGGINGETVKIPFQDIKSLTAWKL